MDLVKICDRVIKYAFYILFLITPFLFNPSTTFPSFELFEWNKMMFVYLITVLVATSWVIKMIASGNFIFQKTPLFWPMLFFLATQVIATIFSIDRYLSIWGYYSRFHGGLLSSIAYVTLYFAFVSNLAYINLKQWLFLLLTAGAAVSIYGIAQRFSIDAHKWVQDVQNRVFSTLGQPNWLAAYLAILLPISISLVLNNLKSGKQFHTSKIQNLKFKVQNKNTKFNKFSILIFTFCIIFYICLLFTKSRSGFLGFWGANGVFWLIIYLTNRPNWKRFLTLFLILNSLFLILNFFIKTPFTQYNRVASIEVFSNQLVIEETKAPIGDSVINIGITDSSKIREIVWQGAVDIIKNYPLFGTGPETFAFAYYRFRPVSHNLTSEWDFLYNRAHNEFLNIGANSGLIGLATYVLLIASIFTSLINQLRKRRQNFLLISAFISSYISILITNFFGFSVVVIGLFFFLLPVLLFVNVEKGPAAATLAPPLSKPRQIFIILVVLSGFAGVGSLGKLWLADSTYAKAISYSRAGDFDLAYQKIVVATNLRPDEPNFHDQRADIAGNLAQSLMTTDSTASAKHFQDAVSQSSLALTTSPQNVNFWKTRTRILFALSEIDPAFLNQALGAIQLAMELSPTDPKLTYNAAIVYGRLNRPEDAISLLQKTIELKGDYRDAYIALSIFYIEQKDNARAREILELALSRINPNDEEIKNRLSEIPN